MLKIRKKIETMLLEKKINIKNSALDYMIQTVKLVWPRGKDGPRKAT